MTRTTQGGYWHYLGRPFIMTTAKRWRQKDFGSQDNMDFLRLAKNAGFTTADVSFDWKYLWTEDGYGNFSGADEYVRYAGKLGMAVQVTIVFETEAPALPKGLTERYGWRIVTETGEELSLSPEIERPEGFDSYVLCNMPLCDPSFLGEVRKFVEAIVSHYRGWEEVICWNIAGEVWGFKPFLKKKEGALETGYDEFTRDRFRRWLKRRYDLRSLTEKWKAEGGYGSWDDVEPPVGRRRADFKGRKLGRWEAAWWDWHSFKLEATTGFLREVLGLIRKLDDRPVLVEYNTGMLGYYNQWDRENRWDLMVGEEGISHLSIQAFERNYKNQIYYNCIARGNSPPPHQLNEINGPNTVDALINEGFNPREVDPVAFTRRMVWLCQAMGATGMNVNGVGKVENLKGLFPGDDEGFKRESFEEVKRTNEDFRRLGEEFASSFPPPPKIATLVLDESTLRESGMAIKLAKPILRVLSEKGFCSEIAVISERQVLEGSMREYPLVFLPRAPYMRMEVAKKLEEYVREGGFLVVGPGSGRYDEYGESYQGLCEPLRRCCGVNPRQMLHPDCDTHDFLVSRDFHRLKKGRMVRGDCFEEIEVEADGAEVPLIYNWQAEQPAMVLNGYGRGRSCYLCFWPSDDREERGLDDVVMSLVEEAGLEPYVRVFGQAGIEEEGVILGVRLRSGGAFLILIETEDREHEVEVEISRGRFGFEDVEVVDGLSGGRVASGLRFSTRLAPAQVKVFHIRP